MLFQLQLTCTKINDGTTIAISWAQRINTYYKSYMYFLFEKLQVIIVLYSWASRQGTSPFPFLKVVHNRKKKTKCNYLGNNVADSNQNKEKMYILAGISHRCISIYNSQVKLFDFKT